MAEDNVSEAPDALAEVELPIESALEGKPDELEDQEMEPSEEVPVETVVEEVEAAAHEDQQLEEVESASEEEDRESEHQI